MSIKNQPKKRITTPLFLQMHVTECGAACLGSVLAYFGRWVPLSELRERCEVSRDGSTAAGILRAARHYGLKSTGRMVPHDQLHQLPAILFWEFHHFLILEGFEGDYAYLNDPSSGRRKVSMEDLSKNYSGIVLEFERTPGFQPGGTRPSILQRIPEWLEGAWGAFTYTLSCGLMLAVLALVAPALLGVFVDEVLGKGESWGMAIATAMALAAVLVYVVTWLKRRCLNHLAIRISVIAGNRCLSKLLRLPIEYFNHRLGADLTIRILSIDKIAKGLAEHVLGLLIEIAMSVVFLAVMLAYDLLLAGVVLGLAILNASLVHVITRMRIDKNHTLRREQGLLVGIGALMVHHRDMLRMTATDDRFFARWSGHQARELTARQQFSEFSHVNAAMPGLFAALGSVAVLAVGSTQVMAGSMTLGALAAFYIVAALFLTPVGRFVAFADERQALESAMISLEDITKTAQTEEPKRRNQAETGITRLDGRLQLTGLIELRDVTFGYNRAHPPLLKDFNLTIRPGQRVAVVGPSGSGKSTILSLISGLCQPWSGEILFDGHPRHEIPKEVLSRSLSMVDQQVVLFAASVRDNITLWNPAVPDAALIAAARDACIHDEILNRPLGYATQIDEGGANFSGGQRQRLEIARALVGDPTVLILDEATSALDAATEVYVDDALRRRGVSCLIVAHRLSTVRDCDQIIVLDKGKEVQRGTHDELMVNREGIYCRLVQAG